MSKNCLRHFSQTGGAFPALLLAAAALHMLVIFGVAFESHRSHSVPPSLEVLLVEKSSIDDPQDAEYLAQASQDGGGQSDEKSRPVAPFATVTEVSKNGLAPTPVAATSPSALSAVKSTAMTQIFSDYTTAADTSQQQIREIDPALEKAERLQRELEIAKLTAEINDSIERFAQRPKKKFLTARTREAKAAAYMLRWVEHVEHIGNLNYPTLARQAGLHGSLILVVAIDRGGNLVSSEVVKSSGTPELDRAADKIVRLASPFPPMPAKLAEETDILYITRTWQFEQDHLISSR
jgi:protein TonB